LYGPGLWEGTEGLPQHQERAVGKEEEARRGRQVGGVKKEEEEGMEEEEEMEEVEAEEASLSRLAFLSHLVSLSVPLRIITRHTFP